MMSWLGVFYVAYRLIKEQMDRSYAKAEAERMRREHPYRTIMSDGLIRETMKYCLRGRKRIRNW